MTKFYNFTFLLLIFFLSLFNTVLSQTTSVPYAASNSWTCPTGVTTVTVQCWGGGGAGGGTTAVPDGGGGGAGGAFAQKVLSVTPGNSYSVNVGAAVAGTTGSGSTGNPSWFSTAGTVYAQGGAGGGTNNGAGGVGSSSSSIGDFVWAGGNGAAGTATYGGGGGGGAGTTGIGGATTTSVSGTGTATGGGNGGIGRNASSNGAAGATYGGGGGGGFRTTAGTRSGGTGAAGEIIIIYLTPSPVITPFLNQTFCTATYPTAYKTVSFSLSEAVATNFDASQTNQILVLTLPAGFAFNTSAGSTVTRGPLPQDITINSYTITASSVSVTITTAATQTNIDVINFNNFQIQATAAGSGDLTRNGGTFLINGSTSIPSSSSSFGNVATSAGPCSSKPDEPNPPPNIVTVPAGSYVIPMDNSHQNLWLTYPFNIKAYGLVRQLLQNDIPVYWVIKSGKKKDSLDFSAIAGR
ncbi:MAG TPA: hypothetical protein VII99_17845, partial [Bacteroidia bacterium]